MSLRGRTLVWMALCFPGLGIGLTAGCLLQLEHKLACGDGFVDELAGEECDPEDPNSPHRTRCKDEGLGGGADGRGMAECSSECKIIATAENCQHCGDDIVGVSEQCDGDRLNGAVCPSGVGQLGCKPDTCVYDVSGCDPCGDGVHSSEIEECDASMSCTKDEDCDAAIECSTLSGPFGPYTSGLVNTADCANDCEYERRNCSYCGDGELTPAYLDHLGASSNFEQPAEICDEEAVDGDALGDYCKQLCAGGNTIRELRCEFACKDDCTDFKESEFIPDPMCCVVGGDDCDPDFPCCYALDHPEDAENACVEVLPFGLKCASG